MINLYTKFEFPTCTRNEAVNGGAKRTNWELGAITGHSRSSALPPFNRVHSHLTNRNYASILNRFQDIASYLSKVTDFDPTPPAFGSPTGVDQWCIGGVYAGIRRIPTSGFF